MSGMILIGAHDTAQIRNSRTPSQPWTKIGGWEKRKEVNRTLCHSACTDVNTVSSFWHWFVTGSLVAQGSSCAFHRIVIPSLVPRHVSRPAQCTQHSDIIFTVLYFSFAHRLRLKVDHVRSTLRRFTRP